MGCTAARPQASPSRLSSEVIQPNATHGIPAQALAGTQTVHQNGVNGSFKTGDSQKLQLLQAQQSLTGITFPPTPEAIHVSELLNPKVSSPASSTTSALHMRESSASTPAPAGGGRPQGISGSTASKPTKSHRPAVFTKGYSKDSGLALGQKHQKSQEALETLMRVLDSCYVFASATEEQKLELAMYMFPVEVNEGEKVITQGDPNSDNFYAIQRGTFDFYVDNQSVARRSGSSREAFFGELALLYNSPRQATAICVSTADERLSVGSQPPNASSKALLWAIDRDTFRQVLAFTNQQRREEKRVAVQSISFLKESLSESQLNRLIEAVNLFHFRSGQRIVRKGDPGDSCYFIKQGTVMCSRIGEDGLGQVELGPGSYFGERALLRDEPRAADVTAVTDVIAMALDRKGFDELLGPLRSVMDDHMKERVVEALPILKELNPQKRQEVMADFELETFRAGDVIVQAGDSKCDKFYVVRAGEVQVIEPEDGSEIALLKEGTWFGEMALLNDEPRVATCIAYSPRVECFVLRRATFQEFCNESSVLVRTNEQRKQINSMRRMSDAGLTGSPVPPSSRKSSPAVSESGGKQRRLSKEPPTPTTAVPALNELRQRHILGKGTFGTVFLVSPHGDLQSLFALKMMNKHNLVRCEQKTNVLNEKMVLKQVQEHPFVLQLFATYQDRDSLYMLLEFVQGGELFTIMQDKYRFPMYPTFFYSACVVDVLEHIHKFNIVYRDLKPENVLIDRHGYVKLADFGFAKRVQDKTYTLCGTPEYLAPEVVLGMGHDRGVDYWGVGILIYEMLVGMSPFADEYDEDQQVVCNNIVKGRVHYDKLLRAIADTESKVDPFWTIPFSQQQQRPPSSPAASPASSSLRSKAAAFITGSASGGQLPVEDLIKRLLNKNPMQRLGNMKDGAKDVKRHMFFCEIQDWEDLRQRRIQAPFIPELSSDDDVSRFDVFEQDAAWPAYKGPQDWCEGF